MGGNDFHPGKIPGQSIEVYGSTIIQGNAAAAIRVRPQNGKTDVKHDGFVARLQDFPNFVKFFVARIKSFIGRMELKSLHFWMAQQLFGMACDFIQISCGGIERGEYSGKRIRVADREVDDVLV